MKVTTLIAYKNTPTEHAINLVNKFKNVYLINDTREDMSYAPSVQPYLIKEYIRLGYYHGEPVCLLDSDVMLRNIDFIRFNDPKQVLFSDTGSYLNATYVNGTDPDILKLMCDIVEIDYNYVLGCDHKSGGVQYLFPHLFDYGFWDRMEQNCYKLYSFMSSYTCKTHEIQKWTALLWASLWELYKEEMKGNITISCSKSLDFSWAVDLIEPRFYDCNILHIAGVTQDMNSTHFFKGDYTLFPPWDRDYSYINKNLCCYKYTELITEYSKIRYSFSTR